MKPGSDMSRTRRGIDAGGALSPVRSAPGDLRSSAPMAGPWRADATASLPASNKTPIGGPPRSDCCRRAKSAGQGAANHGAIQNATLEAIMPVEPTQLVDDVMRQWPATI